MCCTHVHRRSLGIIMAGTLWYMIASQTSSRENDSVSPVQAITQAYLNVTSFEWHHPNVRTHSRAEKCLDGLYPSHLSCLIVLFHDHCLSGHVINRLFSKHHIYKYVVLYQDQHANTRVETAVQALVSIHIHQLKHVQVHSSSI